MNLVRKKIPDVVHDLKCWPEFFKAIAKGVKTFEIRENDRRFKVGDMLCLLEFVPCKACRGTGLGRDYTDRMPCGCKSPHGRFTGQCRFMRVTYITDWAQKENFVVMAIVPV